MRLARLRTGGVLMPHKYTVCEGMKRRDDLVDKIHAQHVVAFGRRRSGKALLFDPNLGPARPIDVANSQQAFTDLLHWLIEASERVLHPDDSAAGFRLDIDHFELIGFDTTAPVLRPGTHRQ